MNNKIVGWLDHCLIESIDSNGSERSWVSSLPRDVSLLVAWMRVCEGGLFPGACPQQLEH